MLGSWALELPVFAVGLTLGRWGGWGLGGGGGVPGLREWSLRWEPTSVVSASDENSDPSGWVRQCTEARALSQPQLSVVTSARQVGRGEDTEGSQMWSGSGQASNLDELACAELFLSPSELVQWHASGPSFPTCPPSFLSALGP